MAHESSRYHLEVVNDTREAFCVAYRRHTQTRQTTRTHTHTLNLLLLKRYSCADTPVTPVIIELMQRWLKPPGVFFFFLASSFPFASLTESADGYAMRHVDKESQSVSFSTQDRPVFSFALSQARLHAGLIVKLGPAGTALSLDNSMKQK